MKKAVVIGSGYAGLSVSSFLAKAGWDVTILEKNESPGGRGRAFAADGFVFDMGPSWYWMPDVFERYFSCFGKKVSDYYNLIRLEPSYRIEFADGPIDVPADYASLRALFEQIEPGAGAQLDRFMEEAAYKYRVGIHKLVHKPGRSWTEFIDKELIAGIWKLDVFTSIRSHVRKYFTNPKLIQMMEFPVLFLGALPGDIPALYSLMNYADVKLGTWYPEGGMVQIGKAMHKLATELGVDVRFNSPVTRILTRDGEAYAVQYSQDGETLEMSADVVIGAGDYHHVEQNLLEPADRVYSEKYWEKRVMAPSCLLYYIGLSKRLNKVAHHTLFFDVDFERHGQEIYANPSWPTLPLFYVSAPSVTDAGVAPPGSENLFFLIPVASGLDGDDETLRDRYFEMIAERYEKAIGQSIRDAIVFKRSYSVKDFKNDYHAFKGNAYGLANTLMQTSILKPSLKSKRVSNLYFTGQLTVPGPGVPPSLISGEVVSKEIIREHQNDML